MKLRHYFISLLTLLFVVSAQQAVADDEQPRFVIPTASLACGDGSTGYAAITESNPYFTVYLWIRNTDDVDTYWNGAPTMKVDGHALTLTGLNNGDGTETATEWTCTEDGKTIYYVKAHGSTFKAGSNESFKAMFSGIGDKSKGNRDDDYYIGLDVYMYENHAEDRHTVSVSGTFASADGVGHHDVKNKSALTLDGESEAKSGTTIFSFKESGWSLLWTNQKELTFTSPDFEEKSGWGKYSVYFYNKESSQVSNGQVKVTVTDNNPNYTGSNNYKTIYYYKGKYADKYEMVFSKEDNKKPTAMTYPSNLNASYDAWEKTISLQWKTENSKNYTGSYDLYRDGSYLTSVEGNSYTDKVIGYDYYNYILYFVPTGWTSGTQESQLSAQKMAALDRNFELGDLNVTVNNARNGYLLTWTASSYTPSATTYYTIYRKAVSASSGNVTFTESDKLTTVKATTATSYSYEDLDINSTDTYSYMVSIIVQDYIYQTKPTQPNERVDGSSLTSFTATRGTYADKVELKWTADVKAQDKMVYVIRRHTIDSGGPEQFSESDAFSTKIATIEDGSTSFTDTQLNCGYYYMYRVDALINGNESQFVSRYCDGFARNTATVTGNVTFQDAGSTIGVEGVRVDFDVEDAQNHRQSLWCTSDSCGLLWKQDNVKLSNYFDKHPFSQQMYVCPDAGQGNDPCLMDMHGSLRLGLSNETSEGYLVTAKVGSTTYKSTHRLRSGEYTHLTFTYDGSGCGQLMMVDADGTMTIDTLFTNVTVKWTPESGYEGRVSVFMECNGAKSVRGYVDEVRFFKRQLTAADVRQNYDRMMGGTEVGLVAYWPMDESINTMRVAYDYSFTDGKANENHAIIMGGTRTATIPDKDQLSLHAVTDTLGYYALQGLSFDGVGTNYTVRPSKGVHEFTPASTKVLVSPETLGNIGPVNFTDKSQFPVEGVVYYENTLYPVEGCRFMVDNVVVTDSYGREVTSDGNGRFTFPVGIGEHIITIEKDGHEFLNEGHWPATGKHNFNAEVNDLTFTDITKAVVAGRIVGGSVERSKPLGLGQSVANVGRATLTLRTSADVKDAKALNVYYDKDKGQYENNPKSLDLGTANPGIVNSTAFVGGYSGTSADMDVKTITIHTDPATGEFAVKLPPVTYYVTTNVENNTEVTAIIGGSQMLNAENVLYTDTATAVIDDAESSFSYHTAFVPTYDATPNISVCQTDNTLGAFGDLRVAAGELNDTVDAYHVDADTGKLVYNYGWPIFTKGTIYTFEISSFERYLNYDADPEHPKPYDQPSSAGTLDINNQMVLGGDTIDNIPLDEEGKYTYTFQAEEANVEPPYTQAISVSLILGDKVTPWYWNYSEEGQSLRGAVFSAKLTGSSFVTKAPDQLLNILRDPFGSNSTVTWATGSTHSVSFSRDISYDYSFGGSAEVKGGAGMTTAVGAVGAYTTIEMKMTGGGGAGFNLGVNFGNNEDITYTTTMTENYSTSSDKRYDGADGDVFIGVSSSLTYGDGSQVMLVNDQNGGYAIGAKDVIVVGETVDNAFAYSQYHIENHLIPELKKLREDKLIEVSEDQLKNYQQTYLNDETDTVIYMTSLHPDDPRFGSDNRDFDVWDSDTAKVMRIVDGRLACIYGPSYSIFPPKSFKSTDDMWDAVQEATEQIKQWEAILRDNEKAKVEAINDSTRRLRETYAWDAGASTSYTTKYESSKALGLTVGFDPQVFTKTCLNVKAEGGGVTASVNAGFELHIATNRKLHATISNSTTDEYTVTPYDPVTDNYHIMERYEAPDGYGWIFRQIGGATSQNYEPALYTKYYQPGTEISKATKQVEVPHIYCAEPVKTNVPAGGPAVFDLVLSNATKADITAPITFGLQVVNDDWGKMAKVQLNGQPMTDNIANIYLTVDDPVQQVALQVYPADNSVVHIDSLHVSFYSDGQWTISDDIVLAAHFLPQPDQVELAVDKTLIYTGTDSTLTLNAKGYNVNSSVLNAVKLQQRRNGGVWSTIHSWVKGTPSSSTESALVAEIDTLIDMRNGNVWPDGAYEFRAVTDCTIDGQHLEGMSEAVAVTKDVTLPQLISIPKPQDGVLNAGDDISVTFNENIYQNLSKDANFIIQGVLNTDSVAHEVALQMDGSPAPVATSQSGLTLGNTSFTVCTWLKYNGGAGTILRHGDGMNAFRINIGDDGVLTTYITDENGNAQPYKANEALPTDKWLYLGVTYDVVGGTLSAYYASGEDTRVLMSNVAVGTKASSQGNISLGENLSGAMHELSLYSTALNWSAIQQQMYTGKNNSTPSLIGYWRLDEGHGTKGEDLARSRHMLLESPNSWYMENENLALSINGDATPAIPVLSMNTGAEDSYLIEMWARISQMEKDTIQLLSLDKSGALDICVTKDGNLQLVADGQRINQTAAVNDINLNDGLWHHVALNVLRGSDAQANVIVDGTSVLTTASDWIPALKGEYLYMGCDMQGAIDEVRLWHGANTQDAISERRYTRINPENAGGLVGYYPMEHSFYDDYHQRVFEFTPANMAEGAIAQSTLIAVPTDTTSAQPTATLASTTQTPGLKSAPRMSNLKFDFVTNERNVNITLNESPAKMEGCIINTTLRGYSDMHSNVGKPITWSYRVLQNPLQWENADMEVKADMGSSMEFTATLTNTGADYQEWNMTDLPSWLKASPSSGSVPPHGTQDVTFTVSSSNPIGRYFASVSARTTIRQSSSVENNALDTPLDISLIVKGEQPNWTVESYPESMTVVGQINIDGITSTDTEDLVGAFIYDNGKMRCVGKSQPKYNSKRDAYYVTIVVNGEDKLEGSLVSFRIYDASTGKTYPLVSTSPSVFFSIDATVGSTSQPVVWKNENKLLQTEHLAAGWTNISLYLKPDTDDQHLFDILGNNITQLKVDKNTTLEHKDGQWSASYSPIKPGQMMKVNLAVADTLYVIGDEVNPADWPQTIDAGPNISTWIGVPTQAAMTIDEAFAGIELVENDQVKGEDAVSIYDGEKWDGNLTSILPGKGYIFTSAAEVPRTLVFPATSQTGLTTYRTQRRGIPANYQYAHNMVVLCTVQDEGRTITDDVDIKVYDQYGGLRGVTVKTLRDSLHLVFISGDTEGEPLIIMANVNGQSHVQLLPQGFVRNGILGRLLNPYVIRTSELTDISATVFDARSQLVVYALTGQVIFRGQASDFDRHSLSLDGVYIINETKFDGTVTCRKVRIDRY